MLVAALKGPWEKVSSFPVRCYLSSLGANYQTSPTFESYVEGKARYSAIEVYSQSSFQIPHDYNLSRGTADQNWFTSVVFERSSGCTLQFPSAEIFPLNNFLKRIAAACESIPLE